MNDMELQPLQPKREDSSSKSENEGSVRPPGAEKPVAGCSAEPANKSGSQNKNKYGSVPPPCLKTDAEVSQWLLEAEQEDRRRAGWDPERSDERRGRNKRSGGHGAEDGRPEPISRYLANRRWRHRGCSYRLPVSDPIPMPIIPYDPSNQLWLRQEFRRIEGKATVKKVPKKKKRSMQVLAEDGFAVARGCQSDDDDYNSEDDLEYNEKGEVVCPVCSQIPLEIAVDVTPRGQDTAATILTTADDATIAVVDCPPADAVRDAAFVIAARAAIRKTSVDLLHEIKDHFKN
ncbi:unnamed protein product [Aphis gossypii]|uniref:Uncharacterized protein n=1 Tax=Aphis gossypii TaxID=80765 RepID=A0A9P0J619_APHGO|nr:unnamed protein product [Aphis gossypii]